jgi:hypothetical protein
VFASNYQIVVCDDPARTIGDDENWNGEKVSQGFAGAPTFRMVGTEADLNDHWVELVAASQPPFIRRVAADHMCILPIRQRKSSRHVCGRQRSANICEHQAG